MNARELLSLGAAAPNLRFLVIGGHAVGAHGHTRMTLDLDFLARQTDRDAWTSLILTAGLTKAAESRAFAQFAQKADMGLDLMFVQDETFERMWAESVEKEFLGVRARVPSLDHLLALKLHALKQKMAHRTSRDAEDVEMLARRNGLDLRQPHYEKLFLKYGSREIYDVILRILRY